MHRIIKTAIFLSAYVLLVQSSTARCEFYEYTDKNGVKCFTDDMGLIPENRSNKIRVHKERFDDLSEEEKAEKIRVEQEELSQIREKQAADRQQYEEKQKKIDAELSDIEKKKKLDALKTPVIIENNQVLVPVTLVNANKTVTTTLLLDTGANITTIGDSLAKQLSITNGKRSASRIANGSIMKTLEVGIGSITVGPKSVKLPRISVLPQVGPEKRHQGLLGLDFLKNFQYTIDYKTSHIIWKE